MSREHEEKQTSKRMRYGPESIHSINCRSIPVAQQDAVDPTRNGTTCCLKRKLLYQLQKINISTAKKRRNQKHSSSARIKARALSSSSLRPFTFFNNTLMTTVYIKIKLPALSGTRCDQSRSVWAGTGASSLPQPQE